MRKDQKRVVKRVAQVIISAGIGLLLVGALVFVTQGRDIPILQPAGTIADQQYILILITVALGIFVVVPVFILLFVIAWKYREGNTKAKYEPEMEGHRGLEALWWGIPLLIIVVLAVITWISTHNLDPYKPLESDKQPVKVQVVAMEWKWLFIYPELGTATLNYLNIPKDTPINLEITSDAAMNSFWVPALAGQVYAMQGMTTKLHLMADKTGTFNGTTANISGEGYAGMTFKVYAMEEADFQQWAANASKDSNKLTSFVYNTLTISSKDDPEITYSLEQTSLFHDIIMKYMAPGKNGQDSDHDHEHGEETVHIHEDGTEHIHTHEEGEGH